MRDIEEKFERVVHSLGGRTEAHLMINPRKRQITALVRYPDGRRVVVKWADGDAPGLRREIEVYRTAEKLGYLVAPVVTEENLLVLEYVPSVTLRRWLLDYLDGLEGDRVEGPFERLIDRYAALFEETYTASDFAFGERTRETLINQYSRLFSSGPQGTALTPVERAVNRLRYHVAARRLRRAAPPYKDGKAHEKRIHGDLHLNNLLVTEDQTLKLIDWENATFDSPFVDLIYSAVMVSGLLLRFENHLECFEGRMARLVEGIGGDLRELFYHFYPPFKGAVSCNRRFLHSTKIP